MEFRHFIYNHFMNLSPFKLRIGILGCPTQPEVAWTPDVLTQLKGLGFNAMQLNIAWGSRPADEPLTLEDVVDLPAGCREVEISRPVPVRSDPSPERRAQRRADIHRRIELCKQAEMRTLFHFGAPYNAFYDPDFHKDIQGQMPRCLLDGKTQAYYTAMLESFAAEYPGVDDLLMYTYDQDAWLCSEFGDCPNCAGIPLHERVTVFVNHMAETWQSLVPNGRLYWEPWELSAGQVLKSLVRLYPACVGLSLHTNIAESQATMVADRWFRNTVNLAAQRRIPVIAENYLGAASEELEPYSHLSHPLVTLRMLRTLSHVGGITGIKEYYGLLPGQIDPNLSATGLFLNDPNISEPALLARLTQPYGRYAGEIARFWTTTSEAMEIFPWDSSWFIRQIGRADPAHALNAAFLRGYCAETPAWRSTRAAVFMKVDDAETHPWMLEDVQLRCEMAADRLQTALELGMSVFSDLPPELAGAFQKNLEELEGFLVRTRAYAYHIRATNLAGVLRRFRAAGQEPPARLASELRSVLLADQANMGTPQSLEPAIQCLDKDLDTFLSTYFLPAENKASKGYFSLTSR